MRVTYIEPDGTKRVVEAQKGETLMQVAKRNRVTGIEADCGGACICATCHVYIDEEFLPLLNPPSSEEEGMLDFVFSAQKNSRLSCQVVLSEDMDNIVVSVPES